MNRTILHLAPAQPGTTRRGNMPPPPRGAGRPCHPHRSRPILRRRSCGGRQGSRAGAVRRHRRGGEDHTGGRSDLRPAAGSTAAAGVRAPGATGGRAGRRHGPGDIRCERLPGPGSPVSQHTSTTRRSSEPGLRTAAGLERRRPPPTACSAASSATAPRPPCTWAPMKALVRC